MDWRTKNNWLYVMFLIIWFNCFSKIKRYSSLKLKKTGLINTDYLLIHSVLCDILMKTIWSWIKILLFYYYICVIKYVKIKTWFYNLFSWHKENIEWPGTCKIDPSVHVSLLWFSSIIFFNYVNWIDDTYYQ